MAAFGFLQEGRPARHNVCKSVHIDFIGHSMAFPAEQVEVYIPHKLLHAQKPEHSTLGGLNNQTTRSVIVSLVKTRLIAAAATKPRKPHGPGGRHERGSQLHRRLGFLSNTTNSNWRPADGRNKN
ncbi:hypothetical protein H112_07027 [Trichophyton rubrum D6]|uniref:Uncharacterized protein n=1 Tax=Trichophyton rubrum CBS 288.86 TaxID=1215330 RepID=A0A022VTQ1_TRIRU|nr:hypothetical protein H100_07050 [Trichophyton rubrum MR850]EZF38828.1 hypothetical protein H102_07013 [Trichophyton rubrum CBS 100081]EZF49460.1 hypothetical protein H103_07035 [Trichophyton rubrum CBS 288.86]EZF60068.1 hypothetical protein H104_06990 [Trichophyton rubrum CBS 289.86]EZF81471.1 hypothetical protein H110_07031 [Trichophyton rubrum MR1448]EZF92029.1 hypothetical protein H113_07086 [Trichophyton rubrum MR1459]EZG13604.1 hypothetical protein H107_07194 [Trichophyton rubrum CBS 